LIDEAVVQLFQELPPRRVEISLYGAPRETYETVTQVPGSYDKAWAGIRRLLDGGIRVWLKTVLITLNQHEVRAMEEQARALGLPFHTDAELIPCLTGDGSAPLDFRVSPDQAVAYELADEKRRAQWKEQIKKVSASSESSQLYGCGAGSVGFFADASGRLSPCLVASQYRVSPAGRSFRDLWDDELGKIQGRIKSGEHVGLPAELRGACKRCPAANYLESGHEEIESEYVIQTSRLRYQAVMRMDEKGTE
jgi:MoaA/NifB/PqqE/SkfB family radical SAM enzyme